MEYEKYPTFPSHVAKHAPASCAPKAYHAPIAHTMSCPPAYPMYYGAFTSLGVILVLFILLVIVSRSWKI